MRYRRCGYSRLFKLAKKQAEDNDVLRCGECGYIFSPAHYKTRPTQETNPVDTPEDRDSRPRRIA